MIATRNEIKSILGYTDTTLDTRIDALIPHLQEVVSSYCNNRFIQYNPYYTGKVSFVPGADPAYDTINDADNGFSADLFRANMDIYVSDSYHNNGFHTVSQAAVGALTLASRGVLISEVELTTVTIHKVNFPRELKVPFAHLMHKSLNLAGLLVKSESLPGGVSFTYKEDSELMKALFSSFRKPYK